ncbi:MAG: GGDEF domain-containing protein [Clostridia bacterium]|nr:GGDEF domain-containing protein [Clostridia bacterium]
MKECNVKKRKWYRMIGTVTCIVILCVVINHTMISDFFWAFFRDLISFAMLGATAHCVKKFQFEEVTLRDAMTGLYQKEKLDADLYVRCEQKKSFVYILIDLDNFKEVNDQYNHENGDIVLIEFASKLHCIQENAHGDVICYRRSGDEFALIADAHFNRYIKQLEAIKSQISSHKKKLGIEDATIGFSFGVVQSDDIYKMRCRKEDISDVIKTTADALMYQNKRRKKES